MAVTVIGGLGVGGLVAVPAAASGGTSAAGRPGAVRPPASPTTAPPPPTTPPPPGRTASPRARTLAVGQTTLDVEATSAPGHVVALPTVVRYPVLAPGGAGAAADQASGPYPLLVFSQGFGIPAEAYAGLLRAWASAGYVVADPIYPATAPGPGLDEADIVHHPGELGGVITALLAQGKSPGALQGLVEPSQVAVVGHSDGGDVSLAVAADTCCRDPRVK
ncbi:MAG: chlorophyllase/cutinase-like alpha/beta fold protein, partial [Acidimicrobiales bacterium]